MLKLPRRHQINIAGEVLKQLEAPGEVKCYRDDADVVVPVLPDQIDIDLPREVRLEWASDFHPRRAIKLLRMNSLDARGEL